MRRLLILLLLLTLLLAAGAIWAAPNSSFNLPWWTVDGGGAVPPLNGGSYSLQGTTGQADAGMMSNGRYTLNGGYWNRTMTTYTVYLPTVLKP
jgi:hypothetical protein